MTKYQALELFHRLWGKAHNTKTYDKREWMQLFEFLDSAEESKELTKEDLRKASLLVDRKG